MRWCDNFYAQGMMIRLRAAWEASTYFKPEPDAFEKFLETTLITEMAVPDGSDHTNPDFNVGLDRVKRLFDLMELSLRPVQEKEKGKCRKRKAHAEEARGEKKIRSRCDTDPVYLNHLRMYVTERNHKVPWPIELTKDGNNRSKHQIQVFCREYFLLESKNMNPPKDRDEFNTHFKEIVRRFLEIFIYPPPWDLFYAFLNTTAECGPKIWKMWCDAQGHDPPTDEMLKTVTIEKGFKEFRWEMWRLAYKNAVDRGMCPQTAAMAGQLAEVFGLSENAVTIRRRFFRTKQDDPIPWIDEAQEKAAEFATAAEEATATSADAAAAAAAAVPPLPPPPPPPPPRASSATVPAADPQAASADDNSGTAFNASYPAAEPPGPPGASAAATAAARGGSYFAAAATGPQTAPYAATHAAVVGQHAGSPGLAGRTGSAATAPPTTTGDRPHPQPSDNKILPHDYLP